MKDKFDEIRPYYDSEIPEAMKRIAESPMLPLVASYVYPSMSLDDVRKMLLGFNTIRDFQYGVMYDVNKRIIANSISEFTCSGVEQLQKEVAYLYVSNHRDIMLDASLLQNVLVDAGLGTSQITFGANLMVNQLVIDIGKSNKMFKVERPGNSAKEFYKKSLYLSEYIRSVITELRESIWIAQRNGRTKDGNDLTDQGIIKMFGMSEPTDSRRGGSLIKQCLMSLSPQTTDSRPWRESDKTLSNCQPPQTADKIKALADLNIVPVSVSYEWEPCDILKALELYESQFTRYTKKPGEDLNSILTGILQPKGRVHFEICKPITTEELMCYEHQTNSEYHKSVARLIDERILSAYRLYPNNYIAHDLLYGNTKYKAMYTDEQYDAFMRRVAKLNKYDTCDIERLKEIFIGIYANPVKV